MLRLAAPSAIRIPISRVRWVVVNEITPYRPISAKLAATTENNPIRLTAKRFAASWSST